MAQHHEIPFTPETMIRSVMSAAFPPVLTIESGDTVRLSSLPAGGASAFPPVAADVPEIWRQGVAAHPRESGHFLTGPVFVRGAMPGDTLQIDILEAKPCIDFGFVSILPLLGTLPEEFDYETIHPRIDHERQVMTLPWGKELPLDPFFGIMAVAPPAAWGEVSTIQPRAFGGNMDNKELKPGTTLYLPVFNEGALFMAGDGHGVQGDGEVCITALETALTGKFRLTVRRDMKIERPFAESATHLISIGLDEDLDDAAKQAVREMVDHICRRSNLSRNQAYMLCSLIGDLRVTQTVDGNKGVHMMMAKGNL
jgi:acetamidase/formamidase